MKHIEHEDLSGVRRASRRQVLSWAVSGLASGALSACAAPVPAMRVGSIVFPGYELMFLARDLGLLPEQDLRLIELLSNTDTLRALAARQIEAAALTLDELMSARADGVDLRVVLVLDSSEGADVVLGRPGLSLSALAGKRIGAEDSAGGAVMLSALLKAAGLRVDQVRKVSITLDRSEEFYQRGLVDAVVTAEPWAARIERRGALRLFDSSAIPGRIVDVLAVRAEAMPMHEKALRQLVAGHFAALAHYRSQAEDASRRMAVRLQMPAQEVVAAFRGLALPDAAQNREMMRHGGSFERTLTGLQQLMVEATLLPRVQALGDIVDLRFLPS